jgi:formamidopyrimidine-DNA glycosylase
MPELPEVESIRIQLDKYLQGHRVEYLEVRTPKVFQGDPRQIESAKFQKALRFGKMLVVNFANNYSFLAHVKLTGQFIYRGPNLKTPVLSKKIVGGLGGKHTHVIFHLDKGGTLYFNDVRKFGWIKIAKTSPVVANLGPEPLKDLTLTKFTEIICSTKRNIKVLLMDQSKISGVGNIYANDALWDAQIDPKRAANSLSKEETKRLFASIEHVLKQGIKYGGASELAFVTPDGGEGQYQKHFLVYGQTGRLCHRCKQEKIKKYMLSGRGTYWCPKCQK